MAGSVGDSEEFALNLYPMLDIFSILICFLLMSFSTQGESSDVEKITLPDSLATVNLDETPSILISKDEILIQGNKSVALQGLKIPESELNQGALQVAYDEFQKLREVQETIDARGNSDKDKQKTLSLAADKVIPFELIKPVMRAGGQADFIAYQLATQKLNLN